MVVATTIEDPWAYLFWHAYREAQGVPPTSVFFLTPRRGRSVLRSGIEALLLFGPSGTVRTWARAKAVRDTLRRDPMRLFPGTQRFEHVASLNRPEGRARLRQEAPDLLVSVGSPEIFKAAVLQIPGLGAVNIHNGRLPTYRGLFGTFWEMHCGERWGHTSIHTMVAKVDAGGVLVESRTSLGRSLFSVLEEKKVHGGRLLAWLTRYVDQHGRLPPARPGNGEQADGYFGWPSLTDLVRHRLGRRNSPPARQGRAISLEL